ncbi:hypothetical protein I4U23_003952 [Adineta vaga]|nr:hypothetical protein I4U23_003952 [Adineta vaga]
MLSQYLQVTGILLLLITLDIEGRGIKRLNIEESSGMDDEEVQMNSRDLFSVCARMDIWGLSEVAEKLCIGACCAQNCATGKCVKRGGRPVCVCNRCADGGGGGIACLIGK